MLVTWFLTTSKSVKRHAIYIYIYIYVCVYILSYYSLCYDNNIKTLIRPSNYFELARRRVGTANTQVTQMFSFMFTRIVWTRGQAGILPRRTNRTIIFFSLRDVHHSYFSRFTERTLVYAPSPVGEAFKQGWTLRDHQIFSFTCSFTQQTTHSHVRAFRTNGSINY